MTIQQTLSIIKPDAVAKNVIGKILSRFEDNGLKIIAGKLVSLSDEMASGFYAEHEGRPFFPALIEFMTSGPVFVQVLEGDDAVIKNRELMGSTKLNHLPLFERILQKVLMLMLYMDLILMKMLIKINYFFNTEEITST